MEGGFGGSHGPRIVAKRRGSWRLQQGLYHALGFVLVIWAALDVFHGDQGIHRNRLVLHSSGLFFSLSNYSESVLINLT